MRRAAVLAAVTCAVGVLALLLASVVQHTAMAFTLGVGADLPVVAMQPHGEACQTPIGVPPGGDFDHVVVGLGTFGRPGTQLGVEVRDVASQQVLARGRVAAGYPDFTRGKEHSIPVGRVPAGRTIAVCFIDRGTGKVALYGNAAFASRTSDATYNGAPVPADISVRFDRAPRSMASLLGAMADRAALFKADWVGAWTIWLLGALVLLAVPALLVFATRSLRE
jgi:hypothetical protein